MKKTILSILIPLTLILSACAAQPTAAVELEFAESPYPLVTQAVQTVAYPVGEDTSVMAPATQDESNMVTMEAPDGNEVSIQVQLLLGTLKLEGTDLAVTKEQASALLPLWSEFKSLSYGNMTPGEGAPGQGEPGATPGPIATDAAVQQQIDELVSQIQEIMSPEQLDAITEMGITQETMMTLMQELVITAEQEVPTEREAPADRGTPMAGGPQQGNGNQPPQGTPAGGAPGGAGGNNGAGGPPAGAGGPFGGGMVPPGLIDALIHVLETTSGEESVGVSVILPVI